MQYFYDNQFERYLLQFMRIFADISIKTGPDENGFFELKQVPIVNGRMSRHVASILKGNSENTLIPTPMFSAYIKEIELNPKRRQDPYNVSSVSRVERELVNGSYTSAPGNKITVKRHMPVPYDLTIVLDVLTSNQKSKMQILEQILTIFNPSIQLQQNSNAVDWSRLFEVELKQINWSNNSLPMGSDDQKEIASLTFTCPIWINPPALVKQTRRIEQIISNVMTVNSVNEFNSSIGDYNELYEYSSATKVITTPGNFNLSVHNHGGTYLLELKSEFNKSDTTLSWQALLEKFTGVIETTKIRLRLSSDIEDDSEDIVGNITLTNDQNIIQYNIDWDTVPEQTLNITDIIDPRIILPGKNLPVPDPGTKYLISSKDSDTEEYAITDVSPWGINAYDGDIIEFNGINWFVRFSAVNGADIKIYNLADSNIYKFNTEDKDWEFLFIGDYSPGYWRIEQDSSINKNGNNLC